MKILKLGFENSNPAEDRAENTEAGSSEPQPKRDAKYYYEFLGLPEERKGAADSQGWSCVPSFIGAEEGPNHWNMLSSEDIAIEFPKGFVYATEGGGRRGYTTNEAMDKVKDVALDMTADQVRRVHWYGHFPPFVQFRLADKAETACSSPNRGWVPIYGAYIEVDLRFSIPAFLETILTHYRLALTQLFPNDTSNKC